MDPETPSLRKTLFDFTTVPDDPAIAKHAETVDGKLVYRLDPGESVLVGTGFASAMKFPLFFWIAPRSGLASRHGITVTNAPGTVDPDYRGEAGVLVLNRRDTPFYLEHGMRVAQIIFSIAIIPQIRLVPSVSELGATMRGAGGFGSTGLLDLPKAS